MITPDDISDARTWLEDDTEWEKVPQPLKAAIEGLVARYAAHVTAEKDAEIERLSHELVEAEGALWRVFPNTHTIEVPGDPCSRNPDPFEGPGETYADAYNRVNEELEIWKSVFPDIAPERVLPDRSKLEARLAKLEAVAEAARDLSKAFRDDLCRRDHHGYCQSHFLEEDCSKGSRVERLLKALSALDGEKADG